MSFNPRPPVLGGATPDPDRRHHKLYCFNPRPPVLGGATACLGGNRFTTHGFQSSPPGFGGRYTLTLTASATNYVVSILAPRFWGALRKPSSAGTGQFLFQSSPPGFGGRYEEPQHVAICAGVSILAPRFWGALPCAGKFKGHPNVVSILAPRFWGALHLHPHWQAIGAGCFNPRPPVLGGATHVGAHCSTLNAEFQSSPPGFGGRYRLLDILRGQYGTVSILAPRFWGALHVAHGGANPINSRFQSSPPGFGGRYQRTGGVLSVPAGFNPRPPVLGGATIIRLVPQAMRHLFQSSPPGFGGRYQLFQHRARRNIRVSILAPRFWGALHEHAGGRHPANLWFQSSPPGFGGRYQI